jgi:hypothetical protein
MNDVFVLESDAADAPYVTFEVWAEKTKARVLSKLVARLDELGIPREHPARLDGMREFDKLMAARFAADRASLEARQAVKH